MMKGAVFMGCICFFSLKFVPMKVKMKMVNLKA